VTKTNIMKSLLKKIETANGEELAKIISALEKNTNVINCDICSSSGITINIISELADEFEEYYYENIDEEIEVDKLTSLKSEFENYLDTIKFSEISEYVLNKENLYNFNRWLFCYVYEMNFLEWIDFDCERFLEDYCSKMKWV